jgi:PPOX class probable F420-dependent enzyme
VLTQAKAGKAKRIRNNGQVHFAPCTVRGQELGPRVTGTARILSPDEAPTAIRALNRKYGLMKRMFDMFMRGERVYFEITPAPAE